MDYQREPFYLRKKPFVGIHLTPMENRDLDYAREMYPKAFSNIQAQVEKECDRQEFAGSMMFDEYPDRLSLRRIANHIFDEVKKQEKTCKKNCIMYPDNQWLKDIIMVLLVNEMCRRRQKRRSCPRPFPPRW
ncbi:MAG: hypothetical protein K6G85_09190 [Eubacterium sp.]|nr:hypothetical protein [Eubacterium sp.]